MTGKAIILGGYAALVVAAVVLVVHAQRGNRPGSTPAAYLASVTRRPVGRWLVLLLWLWVGWHFFVR